MFDYYQQYLDSHCREVEDGVYRCQMDAPEVVYRENETDVLGEDTFKVVAPVEARIGIEDIADYVTKGYTHDEIHSIISKHEKEICERFVDMTRPEADKKLDTRLVGCSIDFYDDRTAIFPVFSTSLVSPYDPEPVGHGVEVASVVGYRNPEENARILSHVIRDVVPEKQKPPASSSSSDDDEDRRRRFGRDRKP